MASDNSPERDLGTPVEKKAEGDAPVSSEGIVQPSAQEEPLSQPVESKPSEPSHDTPAESEQSTTPASTNTSPTVAVESTNNSPPTQPEPPTSAPAEEPVSSPPAEQQTQNQEQEQSTQPSSEPQPSEPSDTALERKSTPPKEESPMEEAPSKEETPANPPKEESPKKEEQAPQKEETSTDPSTAPEPKEAEDIGISLIITLLLTTGARHPFRVSSKYLRKNAVNVPDYDPYAMSVYTLKELIWREWRSEWEPRPSSPSSIRLISFGKLLEDKSPLSDSKFSRDSPNVIHMTVKPQEVVEEEEAAKGGVGRERENERERSSPGCRCVIL